MINRTMFLFICMLCLLCSDTATCKELNINMHRQNTPVWCWAATIAMMVEYVHGQSIEDCEVLNLYDRSLGGPGTCCLGEPRCNRTGHESEMANILNNIFNIQGRFISRPPSFNELKNSIDNNRPMIALLRSPNSGHVSVVSGYRNPNMVIVLDPMYGKQLVPYNNILRQNQIGMWVGSFLIEGSRNGGPNPPPQPRPAFNCMTRFGSCPMQMPIPSGSPCTCFYPGRGQFPGIAR